MTSPADQLLADLEAAQAGNIYWYVADKPVYYSGPVIADRIRKAEALSEERRMALHWLLKAVHDRHDDPVAWRKFWGAYIENARLLAEKEK
ncbi:MAG: hypothetical protein ACREDM_17505 [Methylocella sp.]